MQKSHQANAPRQTKMSGQITYEEEGRTANKVLPKWRQKCYYEAFVQGLTGVLLLNFSANNPPLRQYPNRYRQAYPTAPTKPNDRTIE